MLRNRLLAFAAAASVVLVSRLAPSRRRPRPRPPTPPGAERRPLSRTARRGPRPRTSSAAGGISSRSWAATTAHAVQMAQTGPEPDIPDAVGHPEG